MIAKYQSCEIFNDTFFKLLLYGIVRSKMVGQACPRVQTSKSYPRGSRNNSVLEAVNDERGFIRGLR